MQLSKFEKNDIELKYIWKPKRKENTLNKNSLVVIITNPMERSDYTDFLFSMSKFSDTNKLFISACGDYRFGLFLMKDGEFTLRDTVVSLIEKYREEVGAEKSDTYLLGFCAATIPIIDIGLHYGYNGIITEILWEGGGIFTGWNSETELEGFMDKWRNARQPQMDFDPVEFNTNILNYTGQQNETRPFKFAYEDVKKLFSENPEKFSVPKFYWFAGINEESYYLHGKRTIEKFNGFGLQYELTVSEKDFDHITALPFFVEYFGDKLKELGVTEI